MIAFALVGWLLVGAAVIAVLFPRERGDLFEGVAAILLWPWVLVLHRVVFPIRRARQERARLARIAARRRG